MKQIMEMENALRQWEDANFLIYNLIAAQVKFKDNVKESLMRGSLANYSEFRSYLLNDRKLVFDQNRFMTDDRKLKSAMSYLWGYPFILYLWTKRSRKVYHITESLHRFFDITGVGNLRWGDIAMPYESFVFTLSRPIKFIKGTEYTCIMVTKIKPSDTTLVSTEYLNFTLLSSNKYKRFKDYEKTALASFIERSDSLEKVRRFTEESAVTYGKRRLVNLSFDIAISDLSGRRVLDNLRDIVLDGNIPVDDDNNEFEQFWPLARQVVDNYVGLCAYLSYCRVTGNSKKVEKKKNDGKGKAKNKFNPIGSLIYDEADVCSVVNVFDIKDLKEGGPVRRGSQSTRKHEKPMTPHPRSGYKRRARSSGEGAPRDQVVKSTYVNMHLLPQGAISGGSLTKIIKRS